MVFKNYLFIQKKFINQYTETHVKLRRKNYYNLNNYNLLIFFNKYGWSIKKLKYNLNKISNLRKYN